MWFRILFLFAHCIFFNQYKFLQSTPLIGSSVRRAYPDEYPFIVSIKFINESNTEPEKDFICTGTIVSKTFVLSVSHGLINVPVQQLEILVGSIDLRTGTKYYPKEFITYEMWANYKKIPFACSVNDLALLRLSKALPRQTAIAVLSPLPPENLCDYELVTAGWGRTTNNYPSRFLQIGFLKVLSKIECKNRIEALTRASTDIHTKFLCSASDPFTFIRNGDSGGPLLLYDELVGVNKGTCPFDESNFNPQKVNIHTGIDCYRYFIIDITTNF